MKRTILKYGLIGGLIMSGLFAISVVIAGDPPDYVMMEIIGYTSMILAMLAIFFGVKSCRDHLLGGTISFGQGMGVGTGIATVAAAVLGFYTFAHIAWVDPNFEEDYSAWQIETIQQSDMSETEKAEEIQHVEELLTTMNSPFMQGLVMFATVFAMGLVATLITAAILKRNVPQGAPA